MRPRLSMTDGGGPLIPVIVVIVVIVVSQARMMARTRLVMVRRVK
jgi:hypothetical protein